MSAEIAVVLKILLILAISAGLYFLAHRILKSFKKKKVLTEQTIYFSSAIIKWALIIIASLVCLQTLGISIGSLWASISAMLMLVAVGFIAVWSVLSNASCALFLVLFAPFRIGDEIEIMEPSVLDPGKTGIKGKVKDISFLYTTLQEAENGDGVFLVRIPNNQFFQKAIRCKKGSNTKSLKQALFESPLTDV